MLHSPNRQVTGWALGETATREAGPGDGVVALPCVVTKRTLWAEDMTAPDALTHLLETEQGGVTLSHAAGSVRGRLPSSDGSGHGSPRSSPARHVVSGSSSAFTTFNLVHSAHS